MYDYLRSQRQRASSNPSPLAAAMHFITTPSSPSEEESYRDEPFAITIDLPPPPYEEFGFEAAAAAAVRREVVVRFSDYEYDVDDNQAGDICKLIAAMMVLALVVVFVGMAFNWGLGW
jgi:hypothetical protein